MKEDDIKVIFRALNCARARYLVAGGLAVVAHGFVRLTSDVDLILDLEDANLRRALGALGRLGYVPRAPVPLMAFADRKNRLAWMREKGLMVFSLFSSKRPSTEIDLFVKEPLDFDAAWGRALRIRVAPGVFARMLGLEDLIRLKHRARRPKDLQDIAVLRNIALQREGLR